MTKKLCVFLLLSVVFSVLVANSPIAWWRVLLAWMAAVYAGAFLQSMGGSWRLIR